MNLLNKLTIKNLKLNRKRTIVTIIGIMLSVALITAVASIYSSGIQSLIKYETEQKGNFHVAYYDVPINEIDKLKNNRKIEKVNLTQNIGYAKIDSKNEYKPYAYIKAFSKDSLENLSIKLVDGRLPQNENEILIPTHLKTNARVSINVGDKITLNVGKRINSEGDELNQFNPFNKQDEAELTEDSSTREIESVNNYEEIVDAREQQYKVVGIIERPASNIEGYSAPGYTFVTYIDENKLSGNVDVYARYTKEGIKNVYRITANIIDVDEEIFNSFHKSDTKTEEEHNKYFKELEKAKYNIDFNDYLIDLETNPLNSSSVGGLGVVAGIVIAIIVFTSIFCIRNSFDISITEKIKQYGMLRSIGATKKQIKKNVFYEATILGIIGIPLGILLGFLASYILIIISNLLLNGMFADTGMKLEFVFSYVAVLIAIILGIVTIYLSAFRSAIKAARVSPIDSIRNSANIKIKSQKIKSPKIIKKVFGIGGEISYKNLKRNKRKYRTTVISIVVSSFVFIALSSFMNMAFDAVDNELKISEYNITLTSSDYNEEMYKKYIETTKLDNIEEYSVVRYIGFELKDAKYNKEYIEWIDSYMKLEGTNYIDVFAVGKYQYNKYIKSLGLNYDEIKNKAILCNYSNIRKYDASKQKNVNKTLKVYDYNVGEKIKGELINKEQNEYEFEIGAISKQRPFGLKNNYGEMIIISDELFDKFASTGHIQINYKSSNANKLQDDITALLAEDSNYWISNIEENVRIMNNLYTLVSIFLYGFIIVISLIGITNIFNTITTNMELRKQEFAMLRSIGMTNKEFKRMIRLESTFMGIKSLLFGVPIGIALSYLIYHFLSGDSGMVYKLPIVAIIINIIAVFILITSIMRYSMNKINKQNTIETIRNENI